MQRRIRKNLDELTLNEIKKFYKDLNNSVLKIFNVKKLYEFKKFLWWNI